MGLSKLLTLGIAASFLTLPLQQAYADVAPEHKATSETKLIVKKTWDAALKEAKRLKLPIMIRFSRGGCPACANLNKHCFAKSEFKNKAGAYVVFLDMEGSREAGKLGQKYGVRSVPSIRIVDHDGKQLDSRNWDGDPKMYLDWAKEVKDTKFYCKGIDSDK